MSRIDHSLFSGHQSEGEHRPCPKCGANLTIKNSKNGPFWGCTRYPECDYSKPISESSVEIVKTMPDTACPKCGSHLQVKKGRFGLFVGCSAYPDCDYIAPNQNQNDTQVTCPSCKKGQLVEKTNRYGKRFFSCTRYPECRYVVNFAPVETRCPDCGWGILVKKAGKLHCPQKTCRYKQDDDTEY